MEIFIGYGCFGRFFDSLLAGFLEELVESKTMYSGRDLPLDNGERDIPKKRLDEKPMRIELMSKSFLGNDGSQSFEFLPGKYQGKRGNDHSVYLEETVIGFFEGFILKRFPTYAHFNFQYIDGPTSKVLASDFKELAFGFKTATDPRGFFRSLAEKADGTKPEFLMEQIEKEGIDLARQKFTALSMALAQWCDQCSSEGMSILGL